METSFGRLVRFADADGKVWFGEAGSVTDPAELIGKSIEIYHGSAPWALASERSGEQREVKEILAPLETVPVFYCIGLNYKKHIEETGLGTPQAPATFFKGPEALGGPLDVIEVHPECPNIDYEGELCVIIGKLCKNIQPDEDPRSYVLGYATGNDVSCRYWQNLAGPGYAKGFDKFSPIGPGITSHKIVPSAENLRVTTKVNGELRQDARTDTLLFSIADLVRFISRGRSMAPGSVIMTGTPSGVGVAKKPPVWIKDGDVVEVEIENLGIIRNKFSVPQQMEVKL